MEGAAERREPERPAPEPEPERAASASEPASELRCPYCHEGLPVGTRACLCDGCRAAHHPVCFAEHGGCATAGCAGATATATVVAPRVDARARCRTCKGLLDPDTWIARCLACGGEHHVECHARAGRCPTPLCGGLASFGTQRALAERAGRARARQAAEVASLVAWGLAISVWAVTAALGLTAIASLLDWAPLPGRTALLVAVGYAVASVAGVALTFHAVRSRTRLRERIASDELEARAGREQRPPGPGPKDGAA